MAKWAKGISGNPGGRPKGFGDIREIARTHTATAIETLVSVMNNPDATASARVAAATALLDRGWGRPTQPIDANIGADTRWIDSELNGLASDLLDKIAGQRENRQKSAEDGSAPAPDRSSNTH